MSYCDPDLLQRRAEQRLKNAEFFDDHAEAEAHANDLRRAGARRVSIDRGNGGKYVVTCDPA
jgi:hypothetical protein